MPFQSKFFWIKLFSQGKIIKKLPSKHYDLVFHEKNYEEDNVRNQILSLANDLKVDYLFIGYSGRKGPKLDPSLLGQTVKNSLYKTQIPLIVVKKLYKRKEKKSLGFNFLACIDGSDKSFKALAVAISLANNENDKIYAITATSLQGEQIVETIKIKIEEIKEQSRSKAIFFETLQPSNDPAKSLVEHVNFNENVDIDFIVVGNNGIRAQIEGKQFLGRMAEYILANAIANPIIIP